MFFNNKTEMKGNVVLPDLTTFKAPEASIQSEEVPGNIYLPKINRYLNIFRFRGLEIKASKCETRERISNE